MKNINIIKNIGWLITDKIVLLILQFFLWVKIANEYGGELFGIFSFGFAIVGFSLVLYEVINLKIVKVKYSELDQFSVLAGITIFRTIIAFIIFGLILLSNFFIDERLWLIMLILSINNIVLSLSWGIESYFEYNLNSKQTVIAANTANVLIYTAQLFLIFRGHSIYVIISLFIVGSLIRVGIVYYLFSKSQFKQLRIKGARLSNRRLIVVNRIIVRDSKYLWLSTISYIIYSQLDKVMLGILIGYEAVGVYQIADRVYKVMITWIGVVKASIFPKAVKLWNENRSEYFKYAGLVVKSAGLISILLLLIVLLMGDFGIELLFEPEYVNASIILKILAFNIFVHGVSIFKVEHLTLNGGTRENAKIVFQSLILNIILNFILIVFYGVAGAAIATVISQIYSSFLGCIIYSKTREYLVLFRYLYSKANNN